MRRTGSARHPFGFAIATRPAVALLAISISLPIVTSDAGLVHAVFRIKPADPFRPNDLLKAMCRRIAAASKYPLEAGWREDTDFVVYRFTTGARARAMKHWIDRSGIAHRPMPKGL